MAGLTVLFLIIMGGGAGWVTRDQAARKTKAANDLETALERAELFHGEGKRPEALAALERAELLSTQAARGAERDARLAGLRERLDAEARDQEFVARFDEIRRRIQSQVDVQQNHYTPEAAYPEVRDALSQYGIELGVTAPAAAAARIQSRSEAIRIALIAALDECLKWVAKSRPPEMKWLLETFEAADDDPWRVRARRALLAHDWQALEQMASKVDTRKQPPNFLLVVAQNLPKQSTSARLDFLRRIQRAYPADLWANHQLAFELLKGGYAAEAVRYFTAALALRPDSPGTYLNRGNALERLGEADAAIIDAQKCIDLAPNYAMAHNNLGLALQDKGRLDQAIVEYRLALQLNKDNAESHTNLGNALTEKGGLLDEAIAEYREAIRLNKDIAQAHQGLGNALRMKNDFAGAMAEYRAAIAISPNYAMAHCNLGLALWRIEGNYREALKELRLGDEIGRRSPNWRYPSAQWVRECEHLVKMDERLSDYRAGKSAPNSPEERAELGEFCCQRQLNHTAARLFEEAFAAQPKLADALPHRYNAACAAALASNGKGADVEKVGDNERARLRRRALEWLQADLQMWIRAIDNGPDKTMPMVVVAGRLEDWLTEADFASVRGPKALAGLPEAERKLWQKLWSDVAAALARVNEKMRDEKK